MTAAADALDPDAADAQAVAATTPRAGSPAVQGIAGWDTANGCAGYYANLEIFRPARI